MLVLRTFKEQAESQIRLSVRKKRSPNVVLQYVGSKNIIKAPLTKSKLIITAGQKSINIHIGALKNVCRTGRLKKTSKWVLTKYVS